MSGWQTLLPLPLKQSMREAMEHLLARYLEIRPLFLGPARPMKVEWNIRPYLGVFPFVLRALGWDREEGGGVLLPASQNTETDTTARGGQGQWASECVCSELGVQQYPIAHSVNHASSQPWELHLLSFSYYCNYKCENCGLNTLLNVCLNVCVHAK